MKNSHFTVVGLIALGALAGKAAADFTEGFEGSMPGWQARNASNPVSLVAWDSTDGAGEEAFGAHSGSRYAFASDNHTTEHGTISSWLFSPVDTIRNGDTIQFWTRTKSESSYPDRLQLFLSTNGSSTFTGPDVFSTGDFTKLLIDINSTLSVGGYPDQDWTLMSVVVSGLNGPVSGRFGFRYFVTDGGTFGKNSNYIGLDDVSFVQAVPAPGALAVLGIASMAAGHRRRTLDGRTTARA